MICLRPHIKSNCESPQVTSGWKSLAPGSKHVVMKQTEINRKSPAVSLSSHKQAAAGFSAPYWVHIAGFSGMFYRGRGGGNLLFLQLIPILVEGSSAVNTKCKVVTTSPLTRMRASPKKKKKKDDTGEWKRTSLRHPLRRPSTETLQPPCHDQPIFLMKATGGINGESSFHCCPELESGEFPRPPLTDSAEGLIWSKNQGLLDRFRMRLKSAAEG